MNVSNPHAAYNGYKTRVALTAYSALSRRSRTPFWRSGSTIPTAWTSGSWPWSSWPTRPTSSRMPSPRSKTTSTTWAWRESTLCSSWSRRKRARSPTPTNLCGPWWQRLLNENTLIGWTGRSGYGLCYLIGWRTSLNEMDFTLMRQSVLVGEPVCTSIPDDVLVVVQINPVQSVWWWASPSNTWLVWTVSEWKNMNDWLVNDVPLLGWIYL